jgi:hypothetical protein
MSYTVGQAQYWDGSSWQPALSNFAAISVGSIAAVTNTSNVNIVTSSTAHTKSAWTQLTGSATADGFAFAIPVGIHVADNNTATLVDIAKGASGSEVAIAENIAVGSWFRTTTASQQSSLFIPLKINKGDRISARVQSARTSGTATFYRGSIIQSPYFTNGTTALVTMGASTATSEGLSMSASANVYVEIEDSTPNDFISLGFYVSQSSTAIPSSVFNLITYATGAAGAEVEIARHVVFGHTSEYVRVNESSTYGLHENSAAYYEYGGTLNPASISSTLRNNYIPIFIPAGTRIAAKINAASRQYMQACVVGVRP